MIASPHKPASRSLRVVRDLEILDTPMERPYDDAVALACHVFDAPMGAVTIIDEHRQWFKASVGLICSETDIESSFCAHAVRNGETLIVEDARIDHRFMANRLVTSEPHIRFYVGAPVYADDVPIGTVCVIDYRPRRADREAVDALEALARQVGELLGTRRMARRLARTEARFEAFMAHAPLAAYIKDDEGRYLYLSPYAEDAFGARVDEVEGTVDTRWVSPSVLAALREHEAEVRATGRAVQREFTTDLDGKAERDWSVVKFPFDDPGGGRLIGAVASDVTVLKDAQRLIARHLAASRQYAERLEDTNLHLETLAATDGLTGLLNRRAFHAEVVARSAQGGFALVMLDVDRFKAYNDAFGHGAGDTVLQRIAEILKDVSRADDLVGRLGGEEFAVLLHNVDLAGASRIAERLRTSVEVGPWSERPVTASLGVTVWEPGDTLERLLKRTDRALYDAKEGGRDRVVLA